MQNRRLSRVEMRDFPGLVTNIDPADPQPGTARDLQNVNTSRPATLEVRPGYLVVRFEV